MSDTPDDIWKFNTAPTVADVAAANYRTKELEREVARLQEQLEAVTRERDHWKLTASVESGKVAFRDSRFATLEARAEAAEARAARLEAALRQIEAGMEVRLHTGETVVMDRDDAAEIARAALDVKEAG